MKKTLLLLTSISGMLTVFGQEATQLIKRPSLSINFFLKDFKTPDLIGSSSITTVFENKQWTKMRDMSPGLNVQYFQGLTDHLDFMAGLGGSFLKYPFLYKSGVQTPVQDKFLLEADASVNLKLLTDKYFMVPYLSAGVGASMYAGTYFGAYIPVGTGLQFNLGEGNFINLQYSYHLGISDLTNYNFQYSLGFASPIAPGKKQVKPAATPPPPVKVEPKDTDGDGIPDDKDQCPTVPGVAKYNGCPVPDTDGDGVNDDNDKCPTVPGLAKYNGCPVPDSDGDGINDDEDKCPTVAGVARYQGCPVPDTDGDGINDEEDKCPNVFGVKENFGCPVVKEEVIVKVKTIAKNIFFSTGSAQLIANSYKPLSEVVKIVHDDPNLKLDIEGYTDNVGNEAVNQALSEKRANAVMQYFIDKGGISADRLHATGYGSQKPIADNKTAKGRAMNRRVELNLRYY
ncbi:OmpA family protein [Hydrotalea sp.]|uniref:OmpA family protein n=1 Tax=Hydrotalea sp. TaxID=2881279 RepID=UPI002610DCA6|nr:OmpA family protein [Hydrotalea sp.]